ncbi:hypothetical protein MD484_g4826, partial [Candolleomyces efflorescens]
MARTKRTAHPVDDVMSSTATIDTPSPAPGKKRRVRVDANPTPPPAKKRNTRASAEAPPPTQPKRAISPDNDEEEEEEDEAAHPPLPTPAAKTVVYIDVDAEDDADDEETPKASKIMSKGKGKMKVSKQAGNLKTQLGGIVGVDCFEEALEKPPSAFPPVIQLPSSAFTLENKAQWAGSLVDDNSKVMLYVKARSSDDPLMSNRGLLDPYMVRHGYYKGLPNANGLQLASRYDRPGAVFTDGTLSSQVPGLSISTWDCYDIDPDYLAGLHRIKNQGIFANPYTADVTDFVFKEEYSRNGAGSAFIACFKNDSRPVSFIMVGSVMKSFLLTGQNVGHDGKTPFAKGITVLQHRLEYERFSCLFCTLWQGEDVLTPIVHRLITIQTHNRRNDTTPGTPSRQAAQTQEFGPKRVGKLEIGTYESVPSPSPSSSSPKKVSAPKKTQTYIDFNSEVPVYDGRCGAFNPEDIAGSLARLPLYRSGDVEIPEGSGAVIAYAAATSKYNSLWRLTFYIQWVVVVADD